MKSRYITSCSSSKISPLRGALHFCHMIVCAIMIGTLAWVAGGCRNSDLWDKVPGPIAEFLNQYFPYSELDSFNNNGNTYHVRIDDGPGLTFDKNYDWTAIDGYGMPMPQVLLFDQLPPKLYDYLQETEQLNSVFSLERDSTRYILTLLESSLEYIIDTGELTTHITAQ